MERTQIFDLMSELKLFGMRSAYDDVMAAGIKRQHVWCDMHKDDAPFAGAGDAGRFHEWPLRERQDLAADDARRR